MGIKACFLQFSYDTPRPAVDWLKDEYGAGKEGICLA
jgi:hypothetical protein